MEKKITEIALAAQESEYTIPEGYTAEIVDGKVIVKKKEGEDERMRKRAIAILKQQRDYWSYDGPPPATPRKDLIDAIDVALSYLEKQKEQKPISLNEPYNPDDYEVVMEGNVTGLRQKEQKFAEWSEEDEKPFNDVLSGLKYTYEDLMNNKSFDSAKDIKEAFDWMQARVKFIRPSWMPSEEQMQALQGAMLFIKMHKASDYDLTPLKSLFKELHEQFKN